MKRTFIAICALFLIVSCEGKQESADTAQGQKAVDTQDGGAIEAIPDASLTEFEEAAAAFIRPFFDEAGTVSETGVAAGDYFDLYIIAEYNALYPMSAFEFKLNVPAGVVIMGATENDSILVSLGDRERDLMLAFKGCVSGPKVMLVKYLCKFEDDFAGGVFETAPGQDLNFLGSTMCDATKTPIRAKAGKAVVKKK